MTAEPGRYPFPRWYMYLSSVVGIIAAVGLVLGVIGVYVNSQQDKENARLLACLDQYASSSSSSSIAVREASVRKDAATAERDDALNVEGRAFQRLVEHIVAQDATPADVKVLAVALQHRADAAEKLDRAQAELDKVRKDNPVPPPPSKFCNA
jgi:uncharacterized membrane protein YccC